MFWSSLPIYNFGSTSCHAAGWPTGHGGQCTSSEATILLSMLPLMALKADIGVAITWGFGGRKANLDAAEIIGGRNPTT